MEFWERSQRVLQGDTPLVKRPKLTDALLRKPPFRFLHDVISEVCRQTGYAKGLYTHEELISTNIKDKERKTMYLWKIINCVGITLQANVPVRPLKIVAGLEPEQTNVFLQMLATATMIDKEISDRAVTRVLAGEKQPPQDQGETQWIQMLKEIISPRVSHSPPVLQQPRQTSQQHSTSKKHHSPAKVASSGQDPKREDITTLERITSSGVSMPQNTQNSDSVLEKPHKSSKPSKKVTKSANLTVGICSKSPTKSSQPDESQSTSLRGHELKPNNSQSQCQRMSSKGRSPTKRQNNKPTVGRPKGSQQTKCESATVQIDNMREFSSEFSTSDVVLQAIGAEATSSKFVLTKYECGPTESMNYDSENKAKPLIHNQAQIEVFAPSPTNQENTYVQESTCPMVERIAPTTEPRPQSARKAPPTTRCSFDRSARENCRKPSIILDKEFKNEDEEDVMPILLPPQALQETILTSIEGVGKLVHDVLENKESLADEESDASGDGNIGIVLGPIRASVVKKEERQTKEEEIQKLKEAIQTLCRTTVPLGKTMDYLQEDADIMRKEYHFWVKEQDLSRNNLEEAKRITKGMLQAQSEKILELEEEIRQQNQQINNFKTQIIRNDERIMKLLQNVTNRSTSKWISLPSGE